MRRIPVALLTLVFAALGCDPGSPSVLENATRPHPTSSPERPEAGCHLDAPRRVTRSLFKLPVVKDGDDFSLPVTFLDGTRATLRYPPQLRSIQDSVSLYTSGRERDKAGVSPQVSYGGVYYLIHGDPIQCPSTRDGSRAGVWGHRDDQVLVLRYGNWYVSVFDDYSDLDVWATHLQGRVTNDGWLVLEGDGRLKIGPEDRHGDTEIMLGGLDPGVLLWPSRCRRIEDTAADVASGQGIDGLGRQKAFAGWCDRDASMRIHVYGTAEFIKRVALGLRIEDVVADHPSAR